MSANGKNAGPNSGTVEYEWDGARYALRFSYDAIDAIERKFGEDWLPRLTSLFNGRSVADLAFVAALASGQTQKTIKQASPPVVPFVNALYKAWELAWHGQEAMTEVSDGSEKKLWDSVRALMRRWRPG
jgi:hypothetical protein